MRFGAASWLVWYRTFCQDIFTVGKWSSTNHCINQDQVIERIIIINCIATYGGRAIRWQNCTVVELRARGRKITLR